MKIVFAMLFSFLIVFSVKAQVNVQEEESVSRFMNDYKRINTENPQQKAWKIQIIATNDRRKMEDAISKFSKYFPEHETDWSHENPYYKVKVGAFETKEDLYSFLLSVKQHFSGAIPVVEEISKSELVNSLSVNK